VIFSVICIHASDQSSKFKWVKGFLASERTFIVDFVHSINEFLPALQLSLALVIWSPVDAKKTLGGYSAHGWSIGIRCVGGCEKEAMFLLEIEV
jgi:hypothetical protein